VTPPSYHDLHITTAQIPRTRIFDLPYGLQVTCSRVSGWELWRHRDHDGHDELLAGEYGHHGHDQDCDEDCAITDMWLVLDVDGHVITDSRGLLQGTEQEGQS
jgi:hypothetical protein